MKTPVYIFSSGELQRQQNTLRFNGPKGMRMVPVETTGELHIFGEVDLNTRVLNFLTQQNIPLHVYNYYGYYAGSYMPREQYVSGYLTLQQATHYNGSPAALSDCTAFRAGRDAKPRAGTDVLQAPWQRYRRPTRDVIRDVTDS